MTLPAALAQGLADACGVAVTGAQRTGGGDINDAFAVTMGDGRRLFVKTRADAPPDEFATEAAGLALARGARRAPRPGGRRALRSSDRRGRGRAGSPCEWVDGGQLDGAGRRALGRGLAALHAAGAPAFGASPPGARPAADGGAAPLRIGPLVLDNDPLPDWPSFYAERRLRPLVARAHDAGALARGAVADIERAVRAHRRARRAARAAGASARRPMERQRARRARRATRG